MPQLEAIDDEDKLYLAEGLSLLLSERVRAFHLETDAAAARGSARPIAWQWGIPQIESLQRRLGVTVGSDLVAHVPKPPN